MGAFLFLYGRKESNMSKINKILDGNYIDIKCNYLRDNVYYLSFILDNKKEYYFKYSYGNDYILYYNKKEYPNNLILDNIIKCCKAFDEVIKKYENEYELVICGKKEEKVFYYKNLVLFISPNFFFLTFLSCMFAFAELRIKLPVGYDL